MAEITQCPSCQRKLQVPETLLGYDVQCPSCGATFVARLPGAAEAYARRAAPPVAEPEYERPAAPYGREIGPTYDDYGRPSRGRYLTPHRGALILVFGILSFFVCPFVFSICAIVMGNADLLEMRAGRMDPEGE